MITPEWSPQSSWQLTSILSQPKRPWTQQWDFWISWLSDCTTELKPAGFYDEMGEDHSLPRWGQLIFITGEVKKRKWLPTGNFGKLQLVFFFACVILSLYHRSFLLLAMKHLKQCHSDSDIVKSTSKNTPTSTLWPGQHLIFCAASLQGLEIFLKHCRSNLMLHCQIPSDATQSCLSSKKCSAYILTLIISCFLIS